MYRLIFLSASFLCITRLPAQTPIPIHSYELNNSYADTYGGNPMVPNGGTLTATSYVFGAGQGPSVTISNSVQITDYTIEMRFTTSYTNGRHKLFDFYSGYLGDNDLYIVNGGLELQGNTSGLGEFILPNVPVTIVIAHIPGYNVTIFVDGILSLEVYDPFDELLLHSTIPVLVDEETSGSLDYFRIYNGHCGLTDSDCDGIYDLCDECPGVDDHYWCHPSIVVPLSELSPDVLCSNNNNTDKIRICHDGNTLCVSESAAYMHLAHGDLLGSCISCSESFVVIETDEKDADAMNSTDYEMWPNPSNDEFTFQWEKPSETLTTIRIIDATGRVLQSIASSDNEINFGQQYAPGLYYAEITTGHDRKMLKLLKTD